MKKSVAGGFLLLVLAAGCGGEKQSRSTASTSTVVQRTRSPQVRAFVRDYKRLSADVRELRTAALKVRRGTLLGTPALRRLTGRFIEDLQKSHLSPKARNRMIDHAAGAVATSCDQCFQMLEAIRPIPEIAGH